LRRQSNISDVSWRDAVSSEPLIVKDGFIYPRDRPGLGIEVNEAEAAKHPFEQEVLMNWFHPDGAVADW
jgi:galactonate dehydratase